MFMVFRIVYIPFATLIVSSSIWKCFLKVLISETFNDIMLLHNNLFIMFVVHLGW